MRVLVLLLALAALARAETLSPPGIAGTVRIAGVGDVMPRGAPVSRELLEDVADVLDVADVSFGTLGAPADPPAALPDLLDTLRWANVTVLSVADRPDVAATLDAVRQAGLVPAGAGHTRELAEAPEVRNVRGVNVGYFGVTAFPDAEARPDLDEPQVAVLDGATLPAYCRRAADLKLHADLVVCTIAWGGDDAAVPGERAVATAHALADAGADVILGHHPHALQPIEDYTARDGRRTVIAYDLGDFMTGTGAILIVEAARDAGGPVRLTAYGYVATCCTGDRVVNLDRKPLGRRLADARRALGPAWVDLIHDKKSSSR